MTAGYVSPGPPPPHPPPSTAAASARAPLVAQPANKPLGDPHDTLTHFAWKFSGGFGVHEVTPSFPLSFAVCDEARSNVRQRLGGPTGWQRSAHYRCNAMSMQPAAAPKSRSLRC